MAVNELHPLRLGVFVCVMQLLEKLKVTVRVPEAVIRQPEAELVRLMLGAAGMLQLSHLQRVGNHVTAGRPKDAPVDQRN